VRAALHFLEDEFKLQETASDAFPREISSSHIRTSVGKYEHEMSTASKRSEYYCYDRLVAAEDIYEIEDETDFTLPLREGHDRCGHHAISWGRFFKPVFGSNPARES
jgi:hypothetical protein